MCFRVNGGKFGLAADVTLFRPGSMVVGSVVYPQPLVGRRRVVRENQPFAWNSKRKVRPGSGTGETKTRMKKRWNPGRSESSSLATVLFFSSSWCIVALMGGGRKQVVLSRNVWRMSSGWNGAAQRPFSPNPFISPQFVEDSHKNGTFCSFHSCRDLIFKLLLIFFTAKKVANHPKIVRGA